MNDYNNPYSYGNNSTSWNSEQSSINYDSYDEEGNNILPIYNFNTEQPLYQQKQKKYGLFHTDWEDTESVKLFRVKRLILMLILIAIYIPLFFLGQSAKYSSNLIDTSNFNEKTATVTNVYYQISSSENDTGSYHFTYRAKDGTKFKETHKDKVANEGDTVTVYEYNGKYGDTKESVLRKVSGQYTLSLIIEPYFWIVSVLIIVISVIGYSHRALTPNSWLIWEIISLIIGLFVLSTLH